MPSESHLIEGAGIGTGLARGVVPAALCFGEGVRVSAWSSPPASRCLHSVLDPVTEIVMSWRLKAIERDQRTVLNRATCNCRVKSSRSCTFRVSDLDVGTTS